MPILSRLPLNYRCWPEVCWDLDQFFYIHIVFSGATATCGQEYYDFVGSNGIDGDVCWTRGVLGEGTECQLRYKTDRRSEYEAARSLVGQWPPAGRSLLCDMKVSCIARLGSDEGVAARGNGDSAPGGGDESETGGCISVSWSACMSDSTRAQRYQLFLDIIPGEYAKDWRHDLARRDGGILSKFSTKDDDAYIGMSAAIDAGMQETNYLFSEMEKLPSASVVTVIARGGEESDSCAGMNDNDDRPGSAAKMKQSYLTKDKKKRRRRKKRNNEEEEERKRHREELKQDYKRRLEEDQDFAEREAKWKEDKRAKDREKRRMRKEKKEKAPMVNLMFGKVFGSEKWDEKMALFQEKGLGRFMPVGDGKLATYVEGGGLEMVDRDYLYRKEGKKEGHPDAREGKVPNCDEAPLYDKYHEWYNSLPIHRDFLDGTDESYDGKEAHLESKQRYYPFIELHPPEDVGEGREEIVPVPGKGDQGADDESAADDESETSLTTDLFGECVDLFQMAYGENKEEGGKEEGGNEGDTPEEREGCICGSGSIGSDEDDENDEETELPIRRGTARTNKRVIDSDSEGDD